jgi:hypothetical protein
LAALRLALGEVAKTREYLRHELEDLRALLAANGREKSDKAPTAFGDGADRRVKKPS